VLQYEYSTTDGKLSYDMSFVDCYTDGCWGDCLAREGGIQIYSSLNVPGACGPYSCPADTTETGTLLCLAGYNIPEPALQPVQMCSTLDEDLILVLCSINPKSPGLDYPDMPAILGDTETVPSATSAAYSSSSSSSSSAVYTPPASSTPVAYTTPAAPTPSTSSIAAYTPVVSIKKAAPSSKSSAVLALVETEIVYVTEHKTVTIDARDAVATPWKHPRRHKHRSPHN